MMRVLLIGLLIFATGCGTALFTTVVLNSANVEAEAKIEQQKRLERHKIEGEVKSVEIKEKIVKDNDPKNIKQIREVSEDGKSIRINFEPGTKTIKCCTVVFKDGREKDFDSVPSVELTSGAYYVIEYNGMNEVVSVRSK